MTAIPSYVAVVTFDSLPPKEPLLTAVVTAMLLLPLHVSSRGSVFGCDFRGAQERFCIAKLDQLSGGASFPPAGDTLGLETAV